MGFSCLSVFMINIETAWGNSQKEFLTDQEQVWLANNPDIQLGFNPHMEPLLIKDENGSYDGIFPTIVDELEIVLGINIDIEVGDWNTVVQKVRKRELDGLLACAPSQAEASNLLKTQSIHNAFPVTFINHNATFTINSLDDLKGKSIAYHQEVKMLEVVLSQLENESKIVPVNSTLEAIRLVLEGKVNVALGINFENYLVAKHALSGIKLSYFDLEHSNPISTCIRNDWPEFVDIFNKGLEHIGRARIHKILTEWTNIKELSQMLILTPEERAWLTGNQRIQVRITNFPPYIIPNQDGAPKGIAVDYLNLIAERTGINVNYYSSGKTFGDALEGLKKHQGPDLILTMMSTPERQKSINFTNDYFESPYMIFMRADNKKIVTKMDDLIGQKIGIAPKTVLHEMILRNYPDSNLILYKNDIQAIEAVSNEKVDAYIGNLTLASYHIINKGLYNLKLAAPSPFGFHVFSMGIRNDWPQLTSIIDKALVNITQDEKRAIRNRYIQIQYDKSNTAEIIKWVVVVLCIASGIVILFIFWNRSLNKQVSLQTKDLLKEVNERKKAEKELRLSAERFERWKSSNFIGIIHSTAKGDIIDANNTTLAMLGYSKQDLTEGKLNWTQLTPPEFLHLDIKAMEEAGEKGTWTPFEKDFFHKDGHRVPILIGGSIFKEAHDEYIVFIIDLTDRKKIEEENKNLENRLGQAQKMEAIGTLAGGIAHDFNNILAAIIGYTEMARDDSPSGSTVLYDLDKVLKAADRAKSLVNQILTFSRQGDTECIPIQPSSIVHEAIKMLRPSLPVTIEINENIDSEVGLISADPTQIHQILMNLGTNAFHAMEDTGGKLDISLTEIDLCREDIASEPHIDSGTFIQLSVRDSGPGMTQEVKDKIFDPYFTTKGVGKGTGMGLSIVHGIIKNYGGFITLSSEPGKGTTFHVFLPVIREKMLSEKEIVELVPIGKERILFVDDEETLTDLGKHLLEKLGYHVTVRNSSIEALETFQNQPDLFDIVITDQTMPGMTGTDLARRMIQIRPDIPVVLCTGYSTVTSEEKAKSIGIKEFALKPLSKKNLAVLIRKVLDNS